MIAMIAMPALPRLGLRSRPAFAALLLQLAAVAACTAEPSEPAPAPSRAGADAPAGTEPPADGAPADAPEEDGPASPQTKDDRLYPLDVGRTWTFAVENHGAGYAGCPAGTRVARVLEEKLQSGKRAFVVQTHCSNIEPTYLADDPTGVLGYYQGAWSPFLATPPVEGKSWKYFNATFEWRRAGSVTVAAGTFEGCWIAAQANGYKNETTLCPGVGPVRVDFSDLNGDGVKAELQSTTSGDAP